MFRAMLVLAAAGALALPAVASAKPATFTAQAYQTSDSHSGNTQHFTETLKANGAVIGTDKIACVLTSASAAKCTAVFTFAKGTVMVAGLLKQNQPSTTMTITGGTGAYKGAKGSMALHFLSGTKSTETFTFK